MLHDLNYIHAIVAYLAVAYIHSFFLMRTAINDLKAKLQTNPQLGMFIPALKPALDKVKKKAFTPSNIALLSVIYIVLAGFVYPFLLASYLRRGLVKLGILKDKDTAPAMPPNGDKDFMQTEGRTFTGEKDINDKPQTTHIQDETPEFIPPSN